MINLFITATDTDAGKTYVARSIIKAFTQRNKKVAVYKPVSAGCEIMDGTLVNEDAKLLMEAANSNQTLAEINPIAFEPPIAPHIAASQLNQQIHIEDLLHGFDQMQDRKADVTITEGAGGWRLPLGQGVFLSQLAIERKLDVVLVVNMKLGCLNHALLTYEAIKQDGLNCIAWVANCQNDMPYLSENIAELKNELPVPHIATLGYQENIDISAISIDLTVLER